MSSDATPPEGDGAHRPPDAPELEERGGAPEQAPKPGRGRGEPELRTELRAIDGRGYKAYKRILGRYAFDGFELRIDHVQGDPFAAPTRVRAIVPAAVAGFPDELRSSACRATALADFLSRRFGDAAARASRRRGIGKSGLIAIDAPGQQVLERTAVLFRENEIEARFVVGLPARGRKVRGVDAAEMLCDEIPRIVASALRHASLDTGTVRAHVETVEDARGIRDQLRERGLVAFVADGSLLPRRSGVLDAPARDGVAFAAPESLRVSFECANGGTVSGLGIPAGVTVIVGGGYHGKSTLLAALARGVYEHLPGDGRECVVADAATVQVRAEDGRSVRGADISAFIGRLPRGGSPTAFDTADASGSTSQAASIVEALEAGARVLLIDEDTSASNFMVRDHRMQRLIERPDEPITPFVDRVRPLYERFGVSTIVVMGGSGDYLEHADMVIGMRQFRPLDLTGRAREVVAEVPTGRRDESDPDMQPPRARIPDPDSLDASRGQRRVRLSARGTDEIRFGRHTIDLGAVAQLIDPSQLRAIADAMVWAKEHAMGENRTLAAVLDAVDAAVAEHGLDAFLSTPRGDLAAFRRFELAAAINRLRSLRLLPTGGERTGGDA